MKQLSFVLLALIAVSCSLIKSQQTPAISIVPLVGCIRQTMTDPAPLPMPKGQDKAIQMDEKSARRLAYYAAGSSGVLAPRGWHCFETRGSNGFILFVTPQLINSLPSNVTGSAIQVSYSDEGTSGRFEAAKIIARVFPTRRAFVRQVIKEGLEPATDFPSGPYLTDQMIYRRDLVVEYRTPPHTDGLGTEGRLRKNYAPISGVIIENPMGDGYLLHTAIRLPPDADYLAPAIIQQFELDNQQASNSLLKNPSPRM